MTGPTEDRPARARVLVPFIIVTLIWSSTWLVITGQLGVVPPSWSVSYRFAIAGATMLGVALFRRDRLALDGAGFAFAAALGLLQFTFNFNLVYRAEQHVASGLVAVVFALLIVPNAIFARIFLKQHVSATFLVASAVAIAGVGLLFVQQVRSDPTGSGETLLGIGLTACGVISASAANVMQASRRATRYPMATMLAWAMLIGAAVNALWAWGTAGPPVMDWRPSYLAGLVYLSVIASALAFTLYFGVIRAIGPAMAAYSGVIIPVMAMLLSTLFEGYRWSLLAAAGGALALVGLVIALQARRPVR